MAAIFPPPGRFNSVALANFCFILLACGQSQSEGEEDPRKTVVTEFDTVISYDDQVLAEPALVVSTDTGLLVYDTGFNQVLGIAHNGVIHEYGREGEGPGEYMSVNNLFYDGEFVYLLAHQQGKILTYEYQGGYISSKQYDPTKSHVLPPSPPAPSEGLSDKLPGMRNLITNLPKMLSGGKVLLPTGDTGQDLYELRSREGVHLADIGQTPEGSTYEPDADEFRSAIHDKRIPGILRPKAFPVDDKKHPDEFFMVYSALGKVAKYNSSGDRLLENRTIEAPELERLEQNYFDAAGEFLSMTDGILRFRKYASGTSNKNGELFLATYTNTSHPMWIHRFDSEGNLRHRYRVESDTGLLPHVALDDSVKRLLVITEDAEIRAYAFE